MIASGIIHDVVTVICTINAPLQCRIYDRLYGPTLRYYAGWYDGINLGLSRVIRAFKGLLRAYNEGITGGYRIDILEFYQEWNRGGVTGIKHQFHPADKTPDSPMLYQSNQQQYTSNIIAVVQHIARHIERQL